MFQKIKLYMCIPAYQKITKIIFYFLHVFLDLITSLLKL